MWVFKEAHFCLWQRAERIGLRFHLVWIFPLTGCLCAPQFPICKMGVSVCVCVLYVYVHVYVYIYTYI